MTKAVNEYEFEGFSTRLSFNRSLGHFRAVNEAVEELGNKKNLADALQALLEDKSIEVHQILPMVQALLVDKFKYTVKSYNLTRNIEDPAALAAELSQWNALDLVAVYHHPESGVMVINPKNAEHWSSLENLKKFEMLNLYLGAMDKTPGLIQDKKFASLNDSALKAIDALLEGKKLKTPAVLTEGIFKFSAPKKAAVKTVTAKAPKKPGKQPKAGKVAASAPEARTVDLPTASAGVKSAAAPVAKAAPAAVAGRMVQSPKVGVPVTNELFHNGNVEAWKRIIDSYKVKYPANKVVVYYDGEIIHDINALFKWGKVKHGTAILFSIYAPTQEEIKDVSRLRKYLQEGASSRFEHFLKGPVGKILELF